jgi:hypothetical protein
LNSLALGPESSLNEDDHKNQSRCSRAQTRDWISQLLGLFDCRPLAEHPTIKESDPPQWCGERPINLKFRE